MKLFNRYSWPVSDSSDEPDDEPVPNIDYISNSAEPIEVTRIGDSERRYIIMGSTAEISIPYPASTSEPYKTLISLKPIRYNDPPKKPELELLGDRKFYLDE
jgi:hypothetical protein